MNNSHNSTTTNNLLKNGQRTKKTLFPKKIDGQQINEKMLNFTHYKKNVIDFHLQDIVVREDA